MLSTFVERAELSARAFYSLGLGKGDACSIFLPNTTEYHYNVYGAWLCQATVSTGDPCLRQSSIASQLEDVKPKIVVCSMVNKDVILSAIEEAKLTDTANLLVLSMTDQAKEDRANNIYSLTALLEQAREMPEIPENLNDHFDEAAVCNIIWSSGTTGRPKGIQVTARQMKFGLKKDKSYVGARSLGTTCFFHSSGFGAPTSALRHKGSMWFFPIEALEGEDCTEKIFTAVEAGRPVVLLTGSHIVVRLREADRDQSAGLDLTSVYGIVPIGSSIPDDSFEYLKGHFPKLMALINMYGQSEFGNMITWSLTPKNLGSVYPGSEVKIVEPDTGKMCGVNEIGEIMARGDYIMMGYLNRPEENAKYFAEDGFVHTGDLGHYDEDLILYYDGRLREIIKYQNVHVPPVEVEEVIRKHPGVDDVGVFGVSHPTDQEHVAAAVVRKKGAASDVTADELKKLVQDQLELPKWLRGGVFFVEKLPKNPIGKLERRKLKEQLIK